ncbi:conserved hypothetical protein [Verticillium alfalfae VaMs.102]|uniref:Fe2OG dioxygenase domain-containing protein n=1 Tax=Verticillium alfalfae (strain VaMs.102 / ATCC MYA-4576 / FGSC 10136) TaxID=526221 RepID=C9SXD8_VERA1|nr:conserved hypothetical protein [Verticillium alfalfae VaMs.102]EEY23328.1 conserved hypothetical protein [Verticillium alfalfae VaMs.102]
MPMILESMPKGNFPARAPHQPPEVVGSQTKRATRPTTSLPQAMIDEAKVPKRERFNPAKHLAYQRPERIVSMKDIGLEGAGISATAISEPFPLFTREAIVQMRAEIFSKDSLENCQYSSTFCKNMIRAMGPAIAPFVYDAWNSPEVLSGISEVAGIELVPVFDIDIGNVNISFDDQTGTTTRDETAAEQVPAFAWHYDSFPFVCVTMLSDCEGMIGGETAIRTQSGEVMKLRGPAMGTAIVLQGRYIEHQALKAFGGSERITMVTSFRARSPFVKDESVLTGVRGISNVSDLYTQYTEYRLEILEDRIRAKRKSENYRAASKRSFDVDEIRVWLETQRQFIDAMLVEIYEVEDGEEE